MGKGGAPRNNASAAPPATPAKKAKLAPGKDDTPVEGGKGSGPPTQATLDRAVYKTIRDVFAELSCWEVDFLERGDPPSTLRQAVQALKWRWFTEPDFELGSGGRG